MAARSTLLRSLKPATASSSLLRSAALTSSRIATPSVRIATSPSQCTSSSSPRTFRSAAILLSRDTSFASKGPASYSDVKKIADQPTGDVYLIDVREPDETAAGMIPSAVGVPLTEFEQAFNANKSANFQQKYSFARPSFDAPIIFYCRSGKRSAQAQEIAKKNGWTNTRNYEGSWLDWVSNQEKGQ